jgi:hypothetical protein
MISSRRKGKTIHGETGDMINHVNHQCLQEAVKSLILPICRADERTANYYAVTSATMIQIGRESRERHCVEFKPYIFDKVHIFPPTTSTRTAKVKALLLSNSQ